MCSLYDCTYDFRQYWVRTKLAEAQVGAVVPAENEYRVKPVPCFECDSSSIESAYSEKVPYIRDGLLFYCKAAYYHLGTTPFVLSWKDEHTSR